MSANDKVAAALGPNVDAVRTDLQRRRELSQMTKPELINAIRKLETGIDELKARIDPRWDD